MTKCEHGAWGWEFCSACFDRFTAGRLEIPQYLRLSDLYEPAEFRDDAQCEYYASWVAYDASLRPLTLAGQAAQARAEVYELERWLRL